MNDKNKKLKRLEVFFEFLVFGVAVGVAEDIIVLKVTTDEAISWNVFGIVLLIAIPFAFLGEVLVDKINFIDFFRKIFGSKNQDS